MAKPKLQQPMPAVSPQHRASTGSTSGACATRRSTRISSRTSEEATSVTPERPREGVFPEASMTGSESSSRSSSSATVTPAGYQSNDKGGILEGATASSGSGSSGVVVAPSGLDSSPPTLAEWLRQVGLVSCLHGLCMVIDRCPHISFRVVVVGANGAYFTLVGPGRSNYQHQYPLFP